MTLSTERREIMSKSKLELCCFVHTAKVLVMILNKLNDKSLYVTTTLDILTVLHSTDLPQGQESDLSHIY